MSPRPFIVALLLLLTALTGCQRDATAPPDAPAQPGNHQPDPIRFNTDRLQAGATPYIIVATPYREIDGAIA